MALLPFYPLMLRNKEGQECSVLNIEQFNGEAGRTGAPATVPLRREDSCLERHSLMTTNSISPGFNSRPFSWDAWPFFTEILSSLVRRPLVS
jgi:hypothetical protein